MSEHTHGRHRQAARYNPVSELSTIVKAAGETGARVSAVLAASGGLVATFALPAHAAGARTEAAATHSTTTAAAPAASLRAAAAAPAVVAPAVAAPAAKPTATFGVAGVKAVAKPKPKPKPKPVVQAAAPATSTAARSESGASRSAQRAPVANVAQSASGVVNIARTLLGIPYVYGGTTTAGFDCSGFTSYVFAKAGVSLPRTAAAQQAAATPVSSPQPGDLVFFGSPAWHVGIYTGNGMMIDSPKPGKSTSERAIFSGVSGYGRF
ncbi:C40 family peptidase [Phycicoccus sp. MAQZ13P-2]|uniref:C40 family peptidase n=1 Tax=Phycicoccus mangrovi TaxID=2840470 RepID=UPI001C005C8B|nr:C40 family peptidase [Phycicoccus mangrovi]MBT9255073.1 C40 family peptidase [Phycicoccus mangrovi]MBT9274057.1 C40 family peptidase [Phycicoccus mangrovi]